MQTTLQTKTFGILVFAIFKVISPVFCQNFCLEAEMRQWHFQQNAALSLKQDSLENKIIEAQETAHRISGNSVLPIVFHVIHENGAENISNAQIFNTFNHVNDAFAGVGYFAGQPPTGIQFCLARRNINGFAISSYHRIVSPLTSFVIETQETDLKNLSRFDPNSYINVWIVKSIESQSLGSGIAAYAYSPTFHGSLIDGVVIEANFMNGTPEAATVLAHELGHYLSLYHTFEGGCPNGNCQTQGDRVCDTPPDQARNTGCQNNSCSTDADAAAPNPFTSDVDDLTENFMDYSPQVCYRNFTEGQIARMQTALMVGRNSLLRSEGCREPCNLPIVAAFAHFPDTTHILEGQTIFFSDQSTGATQITYYINGVLENINTDPFITFFPESGSFLIQLVASNGIDACSDSASVLINVVCPVNTQIETNTPVINMGEPATFQLISNENTANTEWYVNGITVGSGSNLVFSFPEFGTYQVRALTYNDTQGCYAESSIFVTVLPPCGGSIEHFAYQSTIPAAGEIFINDLASLSGNASIGCGFTRDALDMDRPVWFKLAQNGDMTWANMAFSNTESQQFLKIYPLANGDFIIYGREYSVESAIFLRCDQNGNVLWTRKIPSDPIGTLVFTPVSVRPDGSVYYLYKNNQFPRLLKINPDGNVAWLKVKPTGTYFEGIQYVDGGVVILTYNNESEIEKYDENGNLLWKKTFEPNFTYGCTTANPNGGFEMLYSIGQSSRLSSIDKDGNVLTVFGVYVQNFSYNHRVFDLERNSDGSLNAIISSSAGTYYETVLLNIAANRDTIWGKGTLTAETVLIPSVNCFTQKNGGFYAVLKGTENSRLINLDAGGEDGGCFLEDFPFVISPFALPFQNPRVSEFITGSLPFDTSIFETIPINLNKKISCSNAEDCKELCRNNRDDDDDAYLDCYDSDCDCFQNADSCTQSLVDFPIKSQLAWQTADDRVSTVATPVVANLNPHQDQISEIIVPEINPNLGENTNKLLIYRGDGINQDNPAELEISGAGLSQIPAATPLIIDINRDGLPEIIVQDADGKIQIFKHGFGNYPEFLSHYSTDNSDPNVVNRLIAADFNGDGMPEILAGHDIYQFGPSFLGIDLVLSPDNSTDPSGKCHRCTGNLPSSAPFVADILSAADCGGDPDCEGLEIAAGPVIYSVDLNIFDGDGLEMKIQRDVRTMTLGIPLAKDGFTTVADLYQTGIPCVIVASPFETSNNPGFYIYNKVGRVKTVNLTATLPLSSAGIGMPVVANVVDERVNFPNLTKDVPEILIVHENSLTCYNLQNDFPLWALGLAEQSGGVSPTCFDFNGDGFQEIVVRDQNNLNMYNGNGQLVNGVLANTRSITVDEYPVIANVDADPEIEVVLTGKRAINAAPNSPYQGCLQVYESREAPWMSGRNFWNQYAYFAAGVSDDLIVPKTPQKHWLEIPENSGKQPLNHNFTQLTTFDSTFSPIFSTPDLSGNIRKTTCENGGLTLEIEICNQGVADAKAGLQLQFYQNNPFLGNALPHDLVKIYPNSIPKDSCVVWILQTAFPTSSQIFGMLNANTNFLPPFDFANYFSQNYLLECDYENNLLQFPINFNTQKPNLGPDQTICESSVLVLNAGSGYSKYEWQDNSSDSLFTAFSEGIYIVKVWDICGQQSADTLQVFLQNLVQFDLGENKKLCPNDSILITLNTPNNLTADWSSADGFTCENCDEIYVSPKESTLYFATAKTGNCFFTDSVRLNISEKIAHNFTYSGGDCDGNLPDYEHETSGGSPPYNWLWSTGETTEKPVFAEGVFEITITDSEGCKIFDTLRLAKVLPPIADILNENPIVLPCSLDTLFLEAAANTSNFTEYNWQGISGEAVGIFGEAQILASNKTGKYLLKVTDTETNCEAVDSIEILPAPPITALETLLKNPTCLTSLDGNIEIRRVIGGTNPFLYNFDNQGFTTNTVFDILTSGVYALEIQDSLNCLFSDTIALNGALCQAVFTANAINPESTDNNLFLIYTGADVVRISYLQIFDRWGDLVFEQKNFQPNDVNFAWDGSFKGKNASVGVYIWKAELVYSDGRGQVIYGNLTLFR